MFSAAIKSGAAGNPTDPKFPYVTMLLHGDGTNGAQNNTFVDSSTNNFTITRNGNTTQGTFSPYGSNWSNYFDGSGDYLTVASNSAFYLSTGNFTVEAWVYKNASGTKIIVGQTQNTSAPYNGWLLYVNSSNFATFEGTNGAAVTATTTFPLNQWVHVAAVRSSSTTTLYINGTSVASGTVSITDFNGNLNIGQYTTPISSVEWNGYISNLRIVKGTAVYTSAFTPPTTPLTAITNTSLLTCADNRFIDDSTNNFTITRNGDVSVQRFSPFSPTSAYSTSVIGGSGYFDGSGDWLSVADVSALQFGTGAFTVECWAYFQSLSAAPIFDQRASGPSTNAFVIYADTSGYLSFYCFSPSVSLTSNLQVKANSWNHIAFVRSGNAGTFYLNGVAASSTVNLASYNNTSSANRIFEAFDPAYVTGYCTDFRIVKGTAVYTSAFTPNTAPLTAISGTSLLLNYTNAGILDNAMMNDLETVGNAQISTSVKKYGTGSMYFDGTGDYLSTPDNPSYAYGSGNFTIEAWIYPTTVSSYHRIYSQYFNPDNQIFFRIGVGVMNFYVVVSATTLVNISSSASSISANTWTHVAIVRNSNTFTIYINGVANGTTTTSITMPDLSAPVLISTYDGTNESFTGYIDDLRITKGVARYTANFTPPTAAFPNN